MSKKKQKAGERESEIIKNRERSMNKIEKVKREKTVQVKER